MSELRETGRSAPRREWARAGAVAWAVLLLAVMFARTRQYVLRPESGAPDEPFWVGSAYYFDLLARGDIHHPDWRLLPARDHPPVGKYLFGLALRITGRRIQSVDLMACWMLPYQSFVSRGGDAVDFERRQAVIRRMSPQVRSEYLAGRYHPLNLTDLRACRGLSLGLGFLTAMGIVAIGRRCGSLGAGRLAALLFVLHPVAVGCYHLILLDIIALAFSTLAVLVLIAMMEGLWDPVAAPPGGFRLLALGILEGLLLALACGSKMNALVVVVLAAVVAMALLVQAARHGGGRWLTAALALGLGFAVGAIVFVAINPALYPDVLGGLYALFDEPARTERIQASFLPGHAATPAAKLRTLAGLLAGGEAGLLVMTLIAAWRTAAAARRPGPWMIVALWWWIALGAVGAWIPFPWERYALPVVPPAALLVADALAAIGRDAGRLRRRATALDAAGRYG
jgi:hypothetical protein